MAVVSKFRGGVGETKFLLKGEPTPPPPPVDPYTRTAVRQCRCTDITDHITPSSYKYTLDPRYKRAWQTILCRLWRRVTLEWLPRGYSVFIHDGGLRLDRYLGKNIILYYDSVRVPRASRQSVATTTCARARVGSGPLSSSPSAKIL